MATCPSCAYSITSGAVRCPNCGIPLEDTSGPTALLPNEAKSPQLHSTESADGARFTAGTILADRYRIIGLLGRGGMGEVYKAEDLKLKQVVALKFLPDAVAMDGAALARFQNEVRITRQISHPNVCRVYDIGEADGSHFLSMEFIDGEDLSLLLRRIGRLPGDKANEIARQICAGLAAAHDNNVLHRDLKPANIMIDGRGKARITDFGVAVVASELLGREAAAGTAAYMAPEQLKGKEVSQRSDIYSLGLVLYELFTGKRVYDSDNLTELIRLHESSTPTNPSDHVQNIDPLVERVILRCLEKDPKKRPATAIQVAAALPGGDPLAAALAAGETPSPEMVAASGEKTGLRPLVALTLLTVIIVGLVANVLIGIRVDWPRRILSSNSPDNLTHKAEDIIQRLGYNDRPVDSGWGLKIDQAHWQHLQTEPGSVDQWTRLVSDKPNVIYYWYRQSPKYLEVFAGQNVGRITENDPPANSISGAVSVRLDPDGRLTHLLAVPPRIDASGGITPQTDWNALFSAAGLDQTHYSKAESLWVPPVAFDIRAAWTGVIPDQPDIPIRIEAAAFRGRPVYFNVIGPWQQTAVENDAPQSAADLIGVVLANVILFSVIIGAILLARTNLKKGRADKSGAKRLASFLLFVFLISWVIGAHHIPNFGETDRFIRALALALLAAAGCWIFYIALEPYLRRRWPEKIVSWNRLLSGKIQDPIIARDVLVAVLVCVVVMVLDKIESAILISVGKLPANPISLTPSMDVHRFISSGLIDIIGPAVLGSFFFFLMMFLARALLRRNWLVAAVYIVFVSAMPFLGDADPLISGPFFVFEACLLLWISSRYGLMTLVVYLFVSGLPISDNFAPWNTSFLIVANMIVLVLACWAFYTSLGGQKLFSGNLLED